MIKTLPMNHMDIGPQTVQNRAKNTSNLHRSSHSYAHTIILYSFVYRLVRPRTAKILAAFSAVDRTNAAKCSRRPKKATKKVAAWCSQLAACMQPNWLHVCSQTGCIHAASMYYYAANSCSHLAANMQPVCSHAHKMKPMRSHSNLCAANVQPMCSQTPQT